MNDFMNQVIKIHLVLVLKFCNKIFGFWFMVLNVFQ